MQSFKGTRSASIELFGMEAGISSFPGAATKVCGCGAFHVANASQKSKQDTRETFLELGKLNKYLV